MCRTVFSSNYTSVVLSQYRHF